MVAFRKAVLFGFLIWLIAFAAAFVLFPIRTAARPLFESIMPVVLAVATVFFSERYFRNVHGRFAREGLFLGIVWLVVNVLVDLPLMLSPSPMQMTPTEYVGDIGLTYLLIPVVTTGIGLVRAHAKGGSPPGGAIS
ncbi:MAG: hypothetical protein P8170_07695 [Gemmatimonadota bacterium]|jgi:hypothetical protein